MSNPSILALAFNSCALIASLDARLRSVLRHDVGAEPAGLLSITLATPELAYRHYTAVSAGGIYWARPEAQHYRLSLGRVITLEARGGERFERLEQGFNALRRGWVHRDPDAVGLPARAFVGFAFDPDEPMQASGQGFANACLCVPSLLLERQGSACALTFTARWNRANDPDTVRRQWLLQAQELIGSLADVPGGQAQSGSLTRIEATPSDDEWLALARRALAAIHEGALDKVVLTRRVGVAGRRRLQPRRLLAWLQDHYPDCVQFAYGGDRCTLVGTSPERLVALHERELVADAVAGTTVRDTNGERDRRLGNALRASSKARHEQRLVVDDIVRTLDPLCVSLNAPNEPQLLKLPTLQHLWSPIYGWVKPGMSLLKIAACLHPTPAVGGVPRREALSWLASQGEQHRGWYTGALGWLNTAGDGELSVILRCAVLREHRADLFAGAGIVADSDPSAELAETEWKLRTMLQAVEMA